MVTDRKKLIELIGNCDCINVSVDGNKYSFLFDLNLLSDHLIANGVVVTNWRDAKTDPPKEWKGADETLINYLVYCPDYGVDIGNYVEPAQRWVVMGLPATVTHWMPLPEAPQNKEQ